MNILGIIPARMASTRFPNKPMAKIAGIPMIGHCYLRSKMSKLLTDVYVATCDQEICDYIKEIDGDVVMTANTHERATDRAAEALMFIEKERNKKYDLVLMIQGDEPLTTPQMIDSCIEPMLEPTDFKVTNLMAKILTAEDFEDPNNVKVVVDKNNFALYFSREPIPSRKKFKGSINMLMQLGIILFNRDFLLEYNNMKQTILEIIESVDMMRVLENNMKIKMVLTEVVALGVDVPEDLYKAENFMKVDKLLPKYK